MRWWKGSYPGVQIGVDGLKEDRKLGGQLGWDRAKPSGGRVDQDRPYTVLKELAKTSKAGHHLLAFFSNYVSVVYFCFATCLPCHLEVRYPHVLGCLDAIAALNVLKLFFSVEMLVHPQGLFFSVS